MRGAIKRYVASSSSSPFFVSVGDAEYSDLKTWVGDQGFDLKRASDYCEYDRIPDLDALRADLQAGSGGPIAVVGLGEYLALCGTAEARRVLSSFKCLTLGASKVVFLLRGVTEVLRRLADSDLRFAEIGAFIPSYSPSFLQFKLYSQELELPTDALVEEVYDGFSALLNGLEKAREPSPYRWYKCRTNMEFHESIYTIKRVRTTFEAIVDAAPDFPLQESWGTEAQWRKFYPKFLRAKLDFGRTMREENMPVVDVESNLGISSFGKDFKSWLVFIALKYRRKELSNRYLRRCVEKAENSTDLRKRLLFEIREISRQDKPNTPRAEKYWAMYDYRKKLLRSCFQEADLEEFVNETRRMGTERVWRLTDETLAERRELVAYASANGPPSYLERIYPDLKSYLETPRLEAGQYSDELTDYFKRYKELKLANELDDEFIARVDKYADPNGRVYNFFPTRDEKVEGWKNKSGVCLYWLDALGAEFMGAIAGFCAKNDLSLSSTITRADLPTITSANRAFYDEWNGPKYSPNKELDDVKHNTYSGYSYENDGSATYLADELELLNRVLSNILSTLRARKYETILLVGDHGASRLAVLRQKEEKYDCGTKGEHSGRCCRALEGVDLSTELPFATEENGWFVLADYGRFKGSRAANVEVHGGATLEEVVVPVVAISLRENEVVVTISSDRKLTARRGVPLNLSFDSNAQLERPIVEIVSGPCAVGDRYDDVKTLDSRNYHVTLSGVERAGKYVVNIYDGKNCLLKESTLEVSSGAAQMNKGFGKDLF